MTYPEQTSIKTKAIDFSTREGIEAAGIEWKPEYLDLDLEQVHKAINRERKSRKRMAAYYLAEAIVDYLDGKQDNPLVYLAKGND